MVDDDAMTGQACMVYKQTQACFVRRTTRDSECIVMWRRLE